MSVILKPAISKAQFDGSGSPGFGGGGGGGSDGGGDGGGAMPPDGLTKIDAGFNHKLVFARNVSEAMS